MTSTRLKKRFLVAVGGAFIVASAAHAAIVQQLDLDAGALHMATITVDDLGALTCTGDCGGLVLFQPVPGPYTTIQVTGEIGQFNNLSISAVGGLTAIPPTLQNLNQVGTSTSGAGTLRADFTNRDYCGAGGPCFGSQFLFSVSSVIDSAISDSTADFAAFADAGNTIPAGSLIGAFTGLTGPSDNAFGTFANPTGGLSGSLTTTIVLNFTGAGTIQSNAQISSAPVPEPGSITLFGIAAGVFAAAFKLRQKAPKT